MEVKGPNDRLSDKQHIWLDALVRLGVDAEVLYVKGRRWFLLMPIECFINSKAFMHFKRNYKKKRKTKRNESCYTNVAAVMLAKVEVFLLINL